MTSPHTLSASCQFLGHRFAAPATASVSPRPSTIAASAALRSPGVASPVSLYEVLGVPAGASIREIKAAYRQLALECHPDVGASADEFMRVHAAYSTLSDPDKRADYDSKLMALSHQSRLRPRHVSYSRSPSFPGSSRRTWETDQCW